MSSQSSDHGKWVQVIDGAYYGDQSRSDKDDAEFSSRTISGTRQDRDTDCHAPDNGKTASARCWRRM
jgi:hypothetical protein